ncbi:MAG: diacylglycerol kinase family protein [Chloroflexota bacterium]|nr:diacylglycerol kinase family protein [Chloroflexota bacterium]MDE2895815.1 diacylglycerol kinase family protein [Chloroflexota bacterium]
MQIQPDDIVFVLNPNSGNAIHPRQLTAICRAATEQAGRRANIITSRSPADAAQTALAAHEAGAAAIFGCGGDGTLSSILQGLPARSPTALGAVPLGTANVWAYETNLPMTPLAAVAAQLAALNGSPGEAMWIDSGRVWSTEADGSVGSQRFLLMASWGLDAAAVSGIAASDRRSRIKRMLGEPAYFFSAVQEAVGRKAWSIAYSLDGGPTQTVDVGLMTVGNTRMLGTWLEVNPRATVVDGELDLLMFRGAPWRALALSPFARHGWLPHGPGVSNLRFRRLEITPLGDPPPMQIDGEIGPTSAYAIDVEPQALRVLCPNPAAPVLGG